jgi:4-hydroxybenzoate polyprenyltransferase
LKTIVAFLRLSRAFNILLISLGTSLFYFFILIPVHKHKLLTTLLPFTTFEFVLFLLSVAFVAAAGSIMADYYNFERDEEFKPEKPLPQGSFTLDTAIYLHGALAFLGIGLGFYLGYRAGNYKIGYIYVICALLLYLYSGYLKKIPLAGNIVISALAGFVLVLLMLFEVTFLNTISFEGAQYVLNILLLQLKFYSAFAFAITFVHEQVTDLHDSEADDAYNIHTFAVQYGKRAAKILTFIILVVLLAGLVFVLYNLIVAKAFQESFYLVVAIGLPLIITIILLFRAEEKKQYALIRGLLKMLLFFGILSIATFYLSATL